MKKQLHSIDRMKVTANYMRCMIHCLVPYMVYNHGMWFFQAEPRLKGMGLSNEDSYSSIRFSLGKDTTESEIKETIEQFTAIVKEIRNK